MYDNATTGNAIRVNYIRRDGGLGIDLGGDGVTPNHGNTVASGPNHLENYPIITSAGSGTTTTVGVSFVGLPNASYTIDFYWAGSPNPSGYGEGNHWLAAVTVTTDSTGQAIAPTTFNLPAATDSGQWITATATDQAGDTSEFSAAWQISALASQVTVTPSTYLADLRAVPDFHRDRRSRLAPPFPPRREPFSSRSMALHSVRPSRWSTAAATSISTSTLPAGDSHDQRGLLGRLDLHHQYRDGLARRSSPRR